MTALERLTATGLLAITLAVAPNLSSAQETAPDAEPVWVDLYTQEDASAVLDARIIALKTVLKLTPQQEPLWPPVETEIRRIAAAAAARSADRQKADPPADFLVVMDRIAGAEAARAADLQAFVAAARPLFDTMEEAQWMRAPAFLGMVDSPDGPQPSAGLWLFENED